MKILSTQSINHKDNVSSSRKKQDFESTLISQKYGRRKYITKSQKNSKKIKTISKQKVPSSKEQSLKQRYHQCKSSHFLSKKDQSKTIYTQTSKGTEISNVASTRSRCQHIYMTDKVYEYCGQIQIWLFERQIKYIPQPLIDRNEISIFNRQQLVEWIFSVNEKFNFKQNTAFLSINILDRILGLINIKSHQLQLFAITCIFVAAKYEQISIPKISDFVYIGKRDQHVTRNNILKLQAIILLNLQFDLSYVSPILFINMIGYKLNVDQQRKKKMIKIVKNLLTNTNFRCWKPSKLVQCAYHQLKEDIYSGIITEKVNVLKIKPSVVLRTQQIIQNTNKLDGIIKALKFRYPLKYLGKKYQEIIIPCIPGIQHQVKENDMNELYQNMFIKVPFQTQTKVIPSGRRSAIYISQNKMLRYKGCGNLLQGFNIQNDQIRGSHFFHSSKRELFMTQFINKLFYQQLKIHPPANKPLYCYNFPQKQLQKVQGINNVCKIIDKYCCIFETKGDRRAGTHLISPLQVFYLNLFDNNKISWKQIFNTKNRIQDGQIVQIVTNFELFMQDGLKFLDIYDNSSEVSNYILIRQIQKFTYLQNTSIILQGIVNKFVPQNYKQSISERVKGVNKWIQSIQAIICRIGWQIGQIKRIMCQKGISWGFFNDHGTQWHCNAHLNNFILTKPQIWQQNCNFFLLPLDYDFAYTKEQFINIELDSQNYGTNDKNMFENYLCAEYNAMEMSLFGMELMSNFTYTIEEEKQKKEQKKMSRICFRDTLVESFTQGMRNKKQVKEKFIKNWNQNIQDIKNITQICLYMSVNFQT